MKGMVEKYPQNQGFSFRTTGLLKIQNEANAGPRKPL